ncbi:MAG: 2-oxo acid dehydrogenase subunit E2, partial [Thiohalocapsa sp.]|nr:2-oxo acid dehydrogenase subunit E2 [Thiohalocapsa sp.]
EAAPEAAPEAASEAAPDAAASAGPKPASPSASAPGAGARRPISPAARRRADELGVDQDCIRGSGPAGAVVLADIQTGGARAARAEPEGAADAAAARPAARRALDLAEMRKAIAAAMSRSKREIPHYYLCHDIDLTAAVDWLALRNADLTPDRRLLMGVLLIKAAALTLRDFPELNGFDRAGRFQPSEAIHVGTATAIRGGGLIAPAIHHTDRLDLADLMERLRDLVARVRSGSLRGSELSDPTVTVSSLGERGVERLYGIIYPPQVAIIGFGTPRQRPWAVGGEVVARPVLSATLAADHRHSDGHRGALFLNRLGQRLQEPDTL